MFSLFAIISLSEVSFPFLVSANDQRDQASWQKVTEDPSLELIIHPLRHSSSLEIQRFTNPIQKAKGWERKNILRGLEGKEENRISNMFTIGLQGLMNTC